MTSYSWEESTDREARKRVQVDYLPFSPQPILFIWRLRCTSDYNRLFTGPVPPTALKTEASDCRIDKFLVDGVFGGSQALAASTTSYFYFLYKLLGHLPICSVMRSPVSRTGGQLPQWNLDSFFFLQGKGQSYRSVIRPWRELLEGNRAELEGCDIP